MLRLAVPQRHAATEAAAQGRHRAAGRRRDPAAARPAAPGPRPLDQVPGGTVVPRRDRRGPSGPRRLDGAARPAWPEEIARAAVTAASAGRGAVIVVPDARDLARVDEALAALAPGEPGTRPAAAAYVTLTADLGPAERYRRWLAALRGEALIVAGTRAAMFAPVSNLGLVVLWDDGDDLHADPRAPYPNAREVLALRAHRAGAAALIGGFARTTEMTQLVRSGWAHDLGPDRAYAAHRRPAGQAGRRRERTCTATRRAMTARLPSLALRTAGRALRAGPVLIQVPRRGYLAADRLRPLPHPGAVHAPAWGNGSAVQRPAAARRAACHP